jgi:hypothetical protein
LWRFLRKLLLLGLRSEKEMGVPSYAGFVSATPILSRKIPSIIRVLNWPVAKLDFIFTDPLCVSSFSCSALITY